MSNNTDTILAKVNGSLGATYERLAGEANIYPGHILELTSSDEFQLHSTAGGNMIPIVARENTLEGEGIDTAYDDGARVVAFIPRPGDVFYARLKDGEDVSIGDLLESAGDGTLQEHVADSSAPYLGEQVKLMALEAVDMSGSSGADPDGFIKVMRI